MFGVVWDRWRGPGFCSRSPLVRSVCFPLVIKQGCVACRVVSALVLVRYQVLFDTDRYLNFVRYSILTLYV